MRLVLDTEIITIRPQVTYQPKKGKKFVRCGAVEAVCGDFSFRGDIMWNITTGQVIASFDRPTYGIFFKNEDEVIEILEQKAQTPCKEAVRMFLGDRRFDLDGGQL